MTGLEWGERCREALKDMPKLSTVNIYVVEVIFPVVLTNTQQMFMAIHVFFYLFRVDFALPE